MAKRGSESPLEYISKRWKDVQENGGVVYQLKEGQPDPRNEEQDSVELQSEDELTNTALPDPRGSDGDDTIDWSDEEDNEPEIEGVLPPDDVNTESVTDHQRGEGRTETIQDTVVPEDERHDTNESPEEVTDESNEVIEGIDPNEQITGTQSEVQIKWEVVGRSTEKFKVFKTEKTYLRLKVKVDYGEEGDVDLFQLKTKLDDFYHDVMMSELKNYSESDYWFAHIDAPELQNMFSVGGMLIRHFDLEEFSRKVFSIYQSNRSLPFNEFTFDINVTEMPEGSARGRNKSSKNKAPKTVNEEIYNRKGVIKIYNTDQSCGYRALAIGYYWHKKGYRQWCEEKKPLNEHPEYLFWRQITSREYHYSSYQKLAMEEFLDLIDKTMHDKNHHLYTYLGDAHYTERCQEGSDCQLCNDVDLCFEQEHCYAAKRWNQQTFGWESQPFGPYQFIEMQRFLETQNLNFMIFDAEDNGRMLWTPGCRDIQDETGKVIGFKYPRIDDTIYLLRSKCEYDVPHFDFVKKVETMLRTDYFCFICNKGHSNINHRCENMCQICGKSPKCNSSEPIDCRVCRRTFRGQECFDYHLIEDSFAYCNKQKICEKCGARYRQTPKDTEHNCFHVKCTDCKKVFTERPHYCMMKPLNKEKLMEEDLTNKIIVTYDIESCLYDMENEPNCKRHIPTLLISETTCERCWDDDSNSKVCDTCGICKGERPADCICHTNGFNECSTCGVGKQVFRSDYPITDFCDYLYFNLAKRAEHLETKILVIAHNSRGYDSHFILRDLFKRRFNDSEDLILNGRKILRLKVNNVIFIDSLSFITLSLADIPKAMGFEDEAKGFFPHKFNVPKNFEYVGQIPSRSDFEMEFMKPEKAIEFLEWYQENEHIQNWNLKEEEEKYCANDVRILTIAIHKYKRQFIKISELDPLTRNFTLASVGLEQFKACSLEENTLAITPVEGYFKNQNKSISADIWLDWLELIQGRRIPREQKIGDYFADGFILDLESEERIVFEFWGCDHHGCIKCKRSGRDVQRTHLGATYDQLYEKTQQKIEFYETYEYELVQIWECEFRRIARGLPQRVEDDDVFEHEETEPEFDGKTFRQFYLERKRYYDIMTMIGHIDLRDAFFGGRVNNIAFYYEFQNGEIGRYLDVTSLYPYVLVVHSYPVGHPEIITSFENNDISDLFGFVKCKILPPNDLFIPVLPYRDSDGKLLFPLCVICGENKDPFCVHTDEERSFVGTYFTEELKLALTKGYKVIEIYEALHWEEKSDQIFKPHMLKWYKEKRRFAGYPSHCQDQQSKDEFRRKIFEKEEIEVEDHEMEKNPGGKFVSKQMCNSLWGKLAQKPNLSQTKKLNSYYQLLKIIGDYKYKVKSLLFIDEETLLINYKFIDDKYAKSGNTNIAIAAMVTAYARMKLYSIIDAIEESKQGRILYFDTDSVIYVDNPSLNWYNPPIGDFLGDMTDELEKYGPNARMVEFASAGAKNYGYVMEADGQRKSTIKVKGINLNTSALFNLNFNTMKEFATKFHKEGICKEKAIKQLQFLTKPDHMVYTKKFDKKYRVVSNKRFSVTEFEDFQTLPYGFQFVTESQNV